MRSQWIRTSTFQQRRVAARSSSPQLKFDSDFFTSCCSNRSAVLVIQTCIVRYRQLTHCLEGNMAKKAKKAKKTAKKAAKKKKSKKK